MAEECIRESTAWGHFFYVKTSSYYVQLGSIKIWCIYSSKSSGTSRTIRYLLLPATRVRVMPKEGTILPLSPLRALRTQKSCHKNGDFIICVFVHVNYRNEIIKSTVVSWQGPLCISALPSFGEGCFEVGNVHCGTQSLTHEEGLKGKGKS